jgi:hypothetical protein
MSQDLKTYSTMTSLTSSTFEPIKQTETVSMTDQAELERLSRIHGLDNSFVLVDEATEMDPEDEMMFGDLGR